MRVLNSTVHGILDYLFVIFLLLAPSVLGLSESVSLLTYIIAAVLFLLSIFTDYELGIVQILQFRLHGLIDLLFAIVILLMPWIAGFDDHVTDANFYLIYGGLSMVIWILTDYRLPTSKNRK